MQSTICLYDSRNKEAEFFASQLQKVYGIEVFDGNAFAPQQEHAGKTIICLGGDGFLLHTIHKLKNLINFQKIYPINYGTIGFLTNNRTQAVSLKEKFENAILTRLNFLKVEIILQNGEKITEFALNDVSAVRQTGQASHLKIIVANKVRIENLVSDGIIIATPAGSTAYNFSVGGPIFGIGSNLLSLQPVAPFRPRHWRGALIPDSLAIEIEVIQAFKRPVSANVDSKHFANIEKLTVSLCREKGVDLLFDKEMPFAEKMLAEQFST
jgi:NAD+ kinase